MFNINNKIIYTNNVMKQIDLKAVDVQGLTANTETTEKGAMSNAQVINYEDIINWSYQYDHESKTMKLGFYKEDGSIDYNYVVYDVEKDNLFLALEMTLGCADLFGSLND
jgi:hypothetical protein